MRGQLRPRRSGGEEMRRPATPSPRRPLRAAAVPPADAAATALGALLAALRGVPPPRRAAAGLSLRGLSYRPAGAPAALVDGVDLDLAPGAAGVLFGPSGAGKTTLLQLVAGLLPPTSGTVSVYRGGDGARSGGGGGSGAPARPPSLGLVFQFPERHFLGATLADELTFGWPADPGARAVAALDAQAALSRLGLDSIPHDTPLRSLSDGYKRRVALAAALARGADVLLLDEPLAGLDWRARAGMAAALADAKAAATLLIVSHDLAELAPLVDTAWEVRRGGRVAKAEWPRAAARPAVVGA